MIIGAGLTKSGCVTLRKALATLGLQAKNVPTKEELLSGKCDAYTGIPCLAYLDEIIAKYPDAKVIYCELNQEDWLKACTEHFGKTENPYYLQLRKLVYGVQTPKKTHLEKERQVSLREFIVPAGVDGVVDHVEEVNHHLHTPTSLPTQPLHLSINLCRPHLFHQTHCFHI